MTGVQFWTTKFFREAFDPPLSIATIVAASAAFSIQHFSSKLLHYTWKSMSFAELRDKAFIAELLVRADSPVKSS